MNKVVTICASVVLVVGVGGCGADPKKVTNKLPPPVPSATVDAPRAPSDLHLRRTQPGNVQDDCTSPQLHGACAR